MTHSRILINVEKAAAKFTGSKQEDWNFCTACEGEPFGPNDWYLLNEKTEQCVHVFVQNQGKRIKDMVVTLKEY